MLLRLFDAVARRSATLFEPALTPAPRASWERPALFVILLVGAILRFYGMGSFGLHGDEEIMGLATRSILEEGSSQMPSGMFYPRALVQLYLMAASATAFGMTEWALRLPSVLCGLLLVVLTYFVGRRFLTPGWNMGLAAIASFLPGLIADSQEARMYIFLLASLAAYAALVIQWEKTDRWRYLAAAIVVMIAGIQFHELAVFGAFLVVFPGLRGGQGSKLLAGLGAFVAIGLGHKVIAYLIDVAYPRLPFKEVTSDFAPEPPTLESTPGALELLDHTWQIAIVVLLAASLAFFVARRVEQPGARILAGLLLFLGLIAQAALHYHVAIVLLICGAAVAQRSSGTALPRLAVLLGVSVLAACAHMALLHFDGVTPFRRVIGGLVGEPSIWPLIQLSYYSRVAWLVAWAGFGWALWRVVTRRPVADHWLFFFLGVWVPLATVGFFRWYVPPRYVEFAMLPMLLGALGTLQQIGNGVRTPLRPVLAAGFCVLAVLAIINPAWLIRSVNPGYSVYPDHKGAAEYIRSLHLGPDDILVAEDVLQQTYYLRHVDYSLVARYDAAAYLVNVNGKFLNMYTHVPLLGSGEELRDLVRKPRRGDVYVIGSGENQEDGRSYMRGMGIAEELMSSDFETVYTGRDGVTKVWKARAPERTE